MTILEPALEIVSHAMNIWDTKNQTKYKDKYVELKHDYDNAYAAVPRDNSVLDNAERELRIHLNAFAIEIRGSDS